jgi:hypothetical protein
MQDRYCEVSPEGDKITLVLHGNDGTLHKITLSFAEASSLAMTLPRLLTTAMSRRFADATPRHVYPAQEYTVESASDQRHILHTLSCGNGFDVVFGIDISLLPSLTRNLAGGQAFLETLGSLRPN